MLGPGIEEFKEWPHGLLAIGTFGNNNVDGDLGRSNFQGKAESSLEEHPEGALRELEELNSLILLHEQIDENSASAPELEQEDPTTTTITNNDSSEKSANENGGHCRESNNVVPSRGSDSCLDNTKNAIGKKSLSFLLKKVFVCRSGFSPAPGLRDPLSESRMEKVKTNPYISMRINGNKP